MLFNGVILELSATHGVIGVHSGAHWFIRIQPIIYGFIGVLSATHRVIEIQSGVHTVTLELIEVQSGLLSVPHGLVRV